MPFNAAPYADVLFKGLFNVSAFLGIKTYLAVYANAPFIALGLLVAGLATFVASIGFFIHALTLKLSSESYFEKTIKEQLQSSFKNTFGDNGIKDLDEGVSSENEMSGAKGLEAALP